MASRSEDKKTPLAVISFSRDLFKTRDRDNGSKGYGCTLMFPKSTDLTGLQELAVEAAVAEWGEKARQMIKDKLIKSPFLDGDGPQGKSKETGEPHKGYPGKTFIRCSSGAEYPPKVFGRNAVSRITEEADIPSGSEVYGVVNAYTWENKENGKGVSFGVSIIQLAKKAEGDDVLGGGGGGPDPEKFLEKIADEGEAPASTKDGKGAGGLFG